MGRTVLWVLFLLALSGTVLAQQRSTKETKLTLVVNNENTEILYLELFDEKRAVQIKKNFPETKLYIGILSGSYELEDSRVKPNSGATITVFTERQFFPNEKFFPKGDLTKGVNVNMGMTKAKVTSSTKGELILVTQ